MSEVCTVEEEDETSVSPTANMATSVQTTLEKEAEKDDTQEEDKTPPLLPKEMVDGQLRCESCLKFFMNKISFNRHPCPAFQEPRVFTCQICDTVFTTYQMLQTHIESIHMKKEEIIEDNNKLYEEHIVTIDDAGTITSFLEKYITEDEIEMEELPSEVFFSSKYKCEFCNLVFRSTNLLSKHMNSHNGPLICEICGLTFSEYKILLKHHQTHSKDKKKNECPQCYKVFPRQNILMKHLETVHEVKPINTAAWICKYCGKKIGTKLSLSIHERIHTGARPYVCEWCGNSFRSKANLIQHHPVHTGIKRYKCPTCNKAFSRKSFVTTHLRVHTGERPYACDICGSRYTQIGDMRRHRKKHINGSMQEFGVLQSPIDICDDDNKLIKVHFPKQVSAFRQVTPLPTV